MLFGDTLKRGIKCYYSTYSSEVELLNGNTSFSPVKIFTQSGSKVGEKIRFFFFLIQSNFAMSNIEMINVTGTSSFKGKFVKFYL